MPNISPREQRMRLKAAIIQAAVALLALTAMLAAGLSREWRLLLFFPLWGGTVGFFQARDKTWVALAARGSRNLEGRVEQIEAADERAQVRRQALRVHLKSLVVAAMLTLSVFVLPVF